MLVLGVGKIKGCCEFGLKSDNYAIYCNIYIQKKSISFGLATVAAWAVIAIIRVARPLLLTTVGIQTTIVRVPEAEKNIVVAKTEMIVLLFLMKIETKEALEGKK